MIEATDDGVVVHVHLQPGAGRDGVVGQHGDALKIRVRARPTDGAANAAVLSLLAQFFDVAPSNVEITGGLRSRAKRVRIVGLTVDDAHERLAPILRPPALGA